MKKNKSILALSLAVVLLFSACGGDTPTSVHPDDLAEPIGGESTVPDETPAVPDGEDTMTDIPPAEGLVHSALTNEWIDQAVADSRPIAVMYPTNKESLPQYNISQAGVLYEAMEEGNISRQMAVIEDWQELELIGNIRSSRDYYAYWCNEWDAILVHWGGTFYLLEALLEMNMDNLTGAAIAAGEATPPAYGSSAFYRWPRGSAPSIHNGFTDGPSLVAAINTVGYDTEHHTFYQSNHFSFMPMTEINTLEDASGSFSATSIDLSKIFPYSQSAFEYDEESGTYLKSMHGAAQMDAATNEQLAFTNIIVQSTAWDYRPDNKYIYFDCVDSKQSGYYFTQGRGIQITWTKEDTQSPTRYYDTSGNEIQLNTGHTYIAIAQEGRDVIYK